MPVKDAARLAQKLADELQLELVDVELVKLCPLYQNSNAVKNNAIYQVDMLLFERQSKRMMQELEVMALLAYPEGFKGSAT